MLMLDSLPISHDYDQAYVLNVRQQIPMTWLEVVQDSNLVPGMSFYLWEPKISVAWVHAPDFLSSWSTKNL